ncbi:MAG: stage III sporulation protein AA [Firmicutes bacterium]|nr:stage III sporulation protein AA [Bacillota bacterium]
MPGEEYRQLLPFLPPELRKALSDLDAAALAGLEEVRLKTERPVLLRFDGCERFLGSGGLTDDMNDARPFSRQEMKKTMLLLSQSSVYAFSEELRRGYITLPGGHRAGFAGRAVLEKGALRTLKDVSSVNLRVARALPGTGKSVLSRLPLAGGALPSTLLVAPPRAGKTTLLRDLARLLSDGVGVSPFRVGLADERSELAACRDGVPQLDVGLRTDVVDGCPKAEAMLLLLRSMGPEVLVTDELGREEDGAAVAEAAMSGVSVLATAHARNAAEARQRPLLRRLLGEGYFRYLVVLSHRLGPGTVEEVTRL